jgi:hypothetical protein
MLRRITVLFLATAVLAVLVGCSKKSSLTAPDTSTGTGYGLVTLHLTDAPAIYDHVFLDVQEVWIHRLNDRTSGDTLGDCDSTRHRGDDDQGEDEGGDHYCHREHDFDGTWFKLSVTPGVMDLLAMQDGVFATLGADSVPAGHYNKIRLVLGTNNSIVVDSVSHPLKIPFEDRLGFLMAGQFEVVAGTTSDIGIDFDAARSIHQLMDGSYFLIPIVRIVPLTNTGNIAGSVKPFFARAWVFAIQGSDTVTSAHTRMGHFTLSMLPGGDYTVAIAPVGGFRDTSLAGVHVDIHRTTDVGVIPLSPAAPDTMRGLSARLVTR